MNEKERVFRKVGSIIREDGKQSSYIGEDDFVSLVKGGITINFHIKQKTLDIENVFRTVKRAQLGEICNHGNHADVNLLWRVNEDFSPLSKLLSEIKEKTLCSEVV